MGMEKETRDDASSIIKEIILKIPDLSVIYWCEKMTGSNVLASALLACHGHEQYRGYMFVSDLIDRTFAYGVWYAAGMSTLLGLLLVIAGSWKLSGEPMNVTGAMSRRAEAFYCATILVSHTLGTALGDFSADSLKLGFGVSAGIFGVLLVVLMGLACCTKVSHVMLFWIAFVITRPFGATFGDLLTKSKAKGGLELGNGPASAM